MATTIPRGNLLKVFCVTVSIDVTSKSANTTGEQDITVNGVQANDIVLAVNKPSHSAGLGIVNARVKSANTISVTFGNFMGVAIDPSAESYTFVLGRPESPGALPSVWP